jgi:hypothetical protein
LTNTILKGGFGGSSHEHLHHSNPLLEVVETIVKISNESKIPMRVRCGVDAKIGFWLKWLLPELFFEKLLRFIFRGMIFREH